MSGGKKSSNFTKLSTAADCTTDSSSFSNSLSSGNTNIYTSDINKNKLLGHLIEFSFRCWEAKLDMNKFSSQVGGVTMKVFKPTDREMGSSCSHMHVRTSVSVSCDQVFV